MSMTTRPEDGWLRGLREAHGISRRRLAEQLEVSHAAVRDYEAAEVSEAISIRTFRRVAHALGYELVISLVPLSGNPIAERRHDQSPPESPPSSSAADPGELDQHLR